MQRRKTLANSLTNAGIIKDKESANRIFDKMNLKPDIRGEKLTIEEFAKLADLITKGI